MDVLILVLLIFGLICFIAAALKAATRFELVGAGLAFWIATEIITRF